jgi:hypothetical protein
VKCRRAFEADLLAVLRGEGDDADFVAHYPTCPDCAAEVRVWGELDAMLRTGAPAADSHPEPESLLAFTDAPATLTADARAGIERHLASCRTCADEVKSIGGFDAARLGMAAEPPLIAAAPSSIAAAPSSIAAPAPGIAARRPMTDVADESPRGGWLGRLVWHPAFAYALVAVLLVPLLRDQALHVTERTRAVDARRDAPMLPPASELAVPPEREIVQKRERALEALADAARAPAAPVPPPAQAPAAPRAEGVFAKRQAAPEEKEARSADAGSARTAPGLAATADSDEAGKEDDEHFANLLGGARAPAAPAARARGNDALPVLAIRPQKPTIVSIVDVEPGVLLRIEPPADLAPGPVDVKVQSRAGQRELGARVTDRANAIVIQIPPHWLASGDYTVTLQPVEGGPPALLGFTVRAPTSGR